MSLEVRIKREAKADIREAEEWYHARSESAESRFSEDLQTLISSIAGNPRMYPELSRGVRYAIMGRFRYSVYFIVDRETIVILGVFHHARRPGAWRRRV